MEHLNKRAGASKYKSKRILRTLAVQTGSLVADVGSGGGFYTYQFAKAIGPNGKVYAVDSNEDSLAYIQEQARQTALENIMTFQTSEDHLVLPDLQFDLIFMRNMFHHLPDPDTYFASIAGYVKPQGKVAIIDYKKVTGFSLSFASRRRHYSDAARITASMQKAGLVLAQTYTFLSNQSFQVFSHP